MHLVWIQRRLRVLQPFLSIIGFESYLGIHCGCELSISSRDHWGCWLSWPWTAVGKSWRSLLPSIISASKEKNCALPWELSARTCRLDEIGAAGRTWYGGSRMNRSNRAERSNENRNGLVQSVGRDNRSNSQEDKELKQWSKSSNSCLRAQIRKGARYCKVFIACTLKSKQTRNQLGIAIID